ncbi:MAG: TonB family protein [Candidatus Marinimicrobia bacterium]|nr:TonB family protein [Candidatus Neomarinimicrobiota bacterium]
MSEFRLIPITLLLLSVSLSQTNVAVLISKDGKIYEQNGEYLFTGKVYALFGNGKKQYEGNLIKGEMDGKWTFFYSNGKKQSLGKFKYDKKVGKWIYWNEKGKIDNIVYNKMESDVLQTIPLSPFFTSKSVPVPLSRIKPRYPRKDQRAGIEGLVVVQTYVDSTGKVSETIIIKGVPYSGLDDAAVKAINKMKFKPAQKDGRPIGVWISIPINFRLKD